MRRIEIGDVGVDIYPVDLNNNSIKYHSCRPKVCRGTVLRASIVRDYNCAR
jgi:hypothetical protein